MEPNAFDLTWRNYLPSTSQLCPCIPLFKQPIRLEDDDDPLFLGPEFHNNNDPYHHQNAVRGYLDDPRDWEFDSMLPEEDPYDTFVTRNPFGKTKRKKKKQRKARPFVVEEPPEFSEEEDAEFLGDDQIQHLAYRHPHDQDDYGEEEYLNSPRGGPVIQEMHTPPQTNFYAPRTMPDLASIQYTYEHDDPSEQPQPPNEPESSTQAAAAQTLLNEHLEDLTDKLIYIKQNIMNLNAAREDDDEQADKTTLKTLEPAGSVNSDKNTVSSLDSIASQALDDYETTIVADEDADHRRYSGASEFRLPLGDHTPPFASEQHPFSYFTQHNQHQHQQHQPIDNSSSSVDDHTPDSIDDHSLVRGVFDLGKRFFGA